MRRCTLYDDTFEDNSDRSRYLIPNKGDKVIEINKDSKIYFEREKNWRFIWYYILFK